MILHDHVLTLEGYKVRLMLGLLGQRADHAVADVLGRRVRRRRALGLCGPDCSRPVLEDGETRVSGAEAILFYLAVKHAPEWLAQDEPAAAAAVVEWLSFSCLSLGQAGLARTMRLFEGDDGSPQLAEATAAAARAYRALDDHLIERELAGGAWLVGGRPTIADVACFPAVALCDDVGLALDRFHGLNRWMARMVELPGFVTMPGVFALTSPPG